MMKLYRSIRLIKNKLCLKFDRLCLLKNWVIAILQFVSPITQAYLGRSKVSYFLISCLQHLSLHAKFDKSSSHSLSDPKCFYRQSLVSSRLVWLMLIKNVQYNTHSATCCIHNTIVLCIKTYLSDTFVRLQAQFVDCFWILAKSAHWRLSRSAPAPAPAPHTQFPSPAVPRSPCSKAPFPRRSHNSCQFGRTNSWPDRLQTTPTTTTTLPTRTTADDGAVDACQLARPGRGSACWYAMWPWGR